MEGLQEIASALFGTKSIEQAVASGAVGNMQMVYGTAMSDSSDGSVLVRLDGGDVTVADTEGILSGDALLVDVGIGIVCTGTGATSETFALWSTVDNLSICIGAGGVYSLRCNIATTATSGTASIVLGNQTVATVDIADVVSAGMAYTLSITSELPTTVTSDEADMKLTLANVTGDVTVSQAQLVAGDGVADETVVELPTSVAANEGDILGVALVGGTFADATVISNVGSGDEINGNATAAKESADAAMTTAETTRDTVEVSCVTFDDMTDYATKESVAKAQEDIVNRIATVELSVDSLSETTQAVNDYMDFGRESGKPTLTIGTTESQAKTKITNTAILFVSDDVELMRLDAEKQAVITSELYLGNYKLHFDSDTDRLQVRYVGSN